jgi:hypothetical protein
VSVVSGTGSATFMSSGEATEGPALRDVAQPILLDFGARGRRCSSVQKIPENLMDLIVKGVRVPAPPVSSYRNVWSLCFRFSENCIPRPRSRTLDTLTRHRRPMSCHTARAPPRARVTWPPRC